MPVLITLKRALLSSSANRASHLMTWMKDGKICWNETEPQPAAAAPKRKIK